MAATKAKTENGSATETTPTPAAVTFTQPTWQMPNPPVITHNPGLRVMNSLTRELDPFITIDGSNRVAWYMCGPTVYAPSHMGHARTYLGFDIIRRILQDYFRYDVTLIMNITDLDDKIIIRAAENNQECSELSKHFEAEFHKDMADLGVQPPTILTRVTEYMDEIIEYIQRLIDGKMAYESNGSVYFDVAAFESTQGMYYCKLCPEQKGNAELLAEGEGKLTQDFVGDKKSPRDFALWKKSKEGEPAWKAPWGQEGRPGWHIECSVMASNVLEKLLGDGKKMDIHSGGIDLKFPHHDNEMAQAEAECVCRGHTGPRQWVNYFVHSGHLHIKGLKMSKSLKNFITIQQALEINSARQIRLLFLMHKYNAPMDYGDNTMAHAQEAEKRFVEFFHNAKALLRKQGLSTYKGSQKWSDSAIQLQKTLGDSMVRVDQALKDDFDTPTVISTLVELVKATNVYMENAAAPGAEPAMGLVVENVAKYITRMFRTLGLINTDSSIGFSMEGSSTEGASGESREQVLGPVLDALLEFRSAVRANARSNDMGAVLKSCDEFRDQQLPPLGIRLEDKANDASLWKLDDPAQLTLEVQQREAEAERKAEEKAKKAAQDAEKLAMQKLSPEEYMKQLTLDEEGGDNGNGDGAKKKMYTQFDESTGMPTHDSEGQPLNKSQIKKAQKLFKTQQAKYEKYLKTLEKTT